MTMNEATLKRIMQETVHETLTGLGFNVKDHQAMQADLAYLHRTRRWHEERYMMIRSSCISFVVPLALYGVWFALAAFL